MTKERGLFMTRNRKPPVSLHATRAHTAHVQQPIRGTTVIASRSEWGLGLQNLPLLCKIFEPVVKAPDPEQNKNMQARLELRRFSAGAVYNLQIGVP